MRNSACTVFHWVSGHIPTPLLFPLPHLPKASNTLATPLGLQVSMGGGNYLLSGVNKYTYIYSNSPSQWGSRSRPLFSKEAFVQQYKTNYRLQYFRIDTTFKRRVHSRLKVQQSNWDLLLSSGVYGRRKYYNINSSGIRWLTSHYHRNSGALITIRSWNKVKSG